MVAVMIGIDPHKASHTAVAIDPAEVPLGQLQVRACAAQVERLLGWAQAWPQRTWAVEGAGGLGHLLARQLLAAGERVLDVPPKLAARVRLLATGDINRMTRMMPGRWRSRRCARPGSARSAVMITPRCSRSGPSATGTWAGSAPRWPRLHQVLCELIPGGVPGEITAGQAERILASITPAEAVEAARWELAAEFTEDLRGIDARIRQTRNKLAAAVRAAGTSLTGLSGVGPVIAAAVIGDVRHVARFPDRDHFAACNGTAPIEVSSGGRKIWRLSRRGNRRLNHAIHMAAVTQIRHRHSQGHACYQKKLAEGKTGKEALRALKRQVSDAIYACLQAGARRAAAHVKSPGGQPGNGSDSSAAGSHPGHRLFGQATPGPAAYPTTPAASFPAPLPSQASGQPGPGPGAARPRQRRPQAPLSSAVREPVMPAAGRKATGPAGHR